MISIRYDSNTLEHALDHFGIAAGPVFWLFALEETTAPGVPSLCDGLVACFDRIASGVPGAMERRSDELVDALRSWAAHEHRPQYVIAAGQMVEGPLVVSFASGDDELLDVAETMAQWLRQLDDANAGISVLAYLLLPPELMGAVDAVLDPPTGRLN